MASSVFFQQLVQFGVESSFAEAVKTMDHQIPVRSVTAEPTGMRATDRSVQSRLWASRPGYKMPRSGGLFRIQVYACGADTDGGYTQDWLNKLLASGFGGSDLTGVAGVCGASATTTSVPNATGTRPRGAIMRFGASRDGRAEGQASVISDPNTDLLFALPGAPGAADVIRPCQMLYPKQTLGSSLRFLLGFTSTGSADYVYWHTFHGCHLENPSLVFPHGDLPYWDLPFRYAYWQEWESGTPPSELTLEDCDTAVVAGGSYMMNTVGTTSANTAIARAVSAAINFNMGLAAVRGHGGKWGGLQDVIEWVRVRPAPDDPAATLSIIHQPSTDIMQEWDTDGSDSTRYHALLTLNAGGSGSARKRRYTALYAPNMFIAGQRPAWTDWNGLHYMESTWALTEGGDTTNDLTRSFIRIGQS